MRREDVDLWAEKIISPLEGGRELVICPSEGCEVQKSDQELE